MKDFANFSDTYQGRMSNVKSFENGTIIHASSSDTKCWTNNTADRTPYAIPYIVGSNIQLQIMWKLKYGLLIFSCIACIIPTMRTIHTNMRYSHTHTDEWKDRESYWSGQNRILPFLKLSCKITSIISVKWRLHIEEDNVKPSKLSLKPKC